jgi:hypothetical protein
MGSGAMLHRNFIVKSKSIGRYVIMEATQQEIDSLEIGDIFEEFD